MSANTSALPPALRHGKRGANITHRFTGENEAVVPWPRVTGRPAHRAARPFRLDGVLVGAMPTAGATARPMFVARVRSERDRHLTAEAA